MEKNEVEHESQFRLTVLSGCVISLCFCLLALFLFRQIAADPHLHLLEGRVPQHLAHAQKFTPETAHIWRERMEAEVWQFVRPLEAKAGYALLVSSLGIFVFLSSFINPCMMSSGRCGTLSLFPLAALAKPYGEFVMMTQDYEFGRLPHFADSLGFPVLSLMIVTPILVLIALIIGYSSSPERPVPMFPRVSIVPSQILLEVKSWWGWLFVVLGVWLSTNYWSVITGILLVLFGLTVRSNKILSLKLLEKTA